MAYYKSFTFLTFTCSYEILLQTYSSLFLFRMCEDFLLLCDEAALGIEPRRDLCWYLTQLGLSKCRKSACMLETPIGHARLLLHRPLHEHLT